MSKRKPAASEAPVPSAPVSDVGSISLRRQKECNAKMKQILAKVEQATIKLRADPERCIQSLLDCETVLLGKAKLCTLEEAVFLLHILRHAFFESESIPLVGNERACDLVTAFHLQFHAALTAVAKEYGCDFEKLVSDQGNEWADLASAARVRDVQIGHVAQPLQVSQLFKTEREAKKRFFSVWETLTEQFKAIDVEFKKLIDEFPDPECSSDLAKLGEVLAHSFRWYGIDGVSMIPVTVPRASLCPVKTKPKAGRRKGTPNSDPKKDQQIADAWSKGHGAFKSLRDLANELGISVEDVRKALDRLRHR